MKVGTDGVLLGAWAQLHHQPDSILDIGAGTGLVSLMLAQRSKALLIDALELDENAFEQCVENFEASPWADRLFCYHASLQEFRADNEDEYELIVSNPPFFRDGLPGASASRDRARQNTSLPYEQLIEGVKELLASKGVFCTIVPSWEVDRLRQLAAGASLLLQRITHIRGHEGARIKRCLMEFSTRRRQVISDELVIEQARHRYTVAYTQLTRDFYLNM